MKKLVTLMILVAVLVACSPRQASSPSPSSSTNLSRQSTWWKKAVFYEIFVRSFFDSNGDGIGDFNGITGKLDYLQNLGVNAIWLMPIHPSPTYHGYDVINYHDVNPDYGTLEDFKHLLKEAHQRGMHVIIDLVLNHTSNQNPLFIDANNNLQSPYRNWYLWSDTDPGTSGVYGPAWHAGKFGYYYGVFGDSMPDLNYSNPDVTKYMQEVVHFWLTNVGVDGFRLDAVNYLIEEGQKLINTSSTHHWLQNFYSAYKADKPDAYTVGEVFGAGAFLAKTYTGDQLDQIFNFEMASGFVNSAQGESNTGMNSAITFMLEDMPEGQFATFLTNHDQNRTMSVLIGNISKAKIAAALMFTAPGTPFVYYGEEIGMQGEKPDEDIRLPMQWSAQANAGFSTATPWRAPEADFPQVNVAAELNDPNSLLSFYKTMITLRHQHPALQDGTIALVSSDNTGVYSILRSDKSEKILTMINLTGKPIQNYNLSVENTDLRNGRVSPKALFGTGVFATTNVVNHGFSAFKPLNELPPYSIYVLTLSQ